LRKKRYCLKNRVRVESVFLRKKLKEEKKVMKAFGVRLPVHFIALICLGLLLVACTGGAGSTPTAVPLTQVTYALGYLHDVQFAPLYVAADKGYFREEGIEIELAPIFEGEGILKIGANELQFGTASAEQVLLARAQDVPLVYVAAWYQRFPIAVVARESLGLESPADLAGHTVALSDRAGSSYLGLRSLLQAGMLNEGEIDIREIGFTQLDAFTSGQEDVVVVYRNNELVRLQAMGEAVTVFEVDETSDLAGNGLITNERTIEERPELVQGMVRAFLRGLQDTIDNPDEAFEISKKYVESLANANEDEQAIQRQVLEASIELWQTEELGVSHEEAWQYSLELLIDMGLLSAQPDLSAAYTNEFVR
jgi:NitT/TauT family transport system substrate-binding protein